MENRSCTLRSLPDISPPFAQSLLTHISFDLHQKTAFFTKIARNKGITIRSLFYLNAIVSIIRRQLFPAFPVTFLLRLHRFYGKINKQISFNQNTILTLKDYSFYASIFHTARHQDQ